MRKLIVCDLDGCLYNPFYLPNNGFYRLCDEAGALAAGEILPELSYNLALKLSQQSFQNHHDCYGSFLPYAAENGRDPIKVRDDLFQKYHAKLFELIQERQPHFFDHTGATKTAFDRLAETDYYEFALLTHSSVKEWGEPVLNRMNILHHFNPKLLFGLNDYDHARKFESPNAMKAMIDASGYDPRDIIFIEDSIRNTVPAFQAYGIRTAITHHDAPAPTLTEGIHWTCKTVADFLGIMEQDYWAALIPDRSTRRANINFPLSHAV